MKIALIVIAVFVLPIVGHGVDDAKRSARREAITQKIKETFPYDPKADKRKEEKKTPDVDDQVVIMERYAVVASSPQHQVNEKIESERQKIKAEQFSFTEGGTILKKDIGKTRIKFGLWDDTNKKGIKILNILW